MSMCKTIKDKAGDTAKFVDTGEVYHRYRDIVHKELMDPAEWLYGTTPPTGEVVILGKTKHISSGDDIYFVKPKEGFLKEMFFIVGADGLEFDYEDARTMEVNGSTYRVADIEKALTSIMPIRE